MSNSGELGAIVSMVTLANALALSQTKVCGYLGNDVARCVANILLFSFAGRWFSVFV
jgi:hypothetical protein